MRAYERKIAVLRGREEDLLSKLETAKQVQVELAKRMMNDMERVRDEWQHALNEKDFELKRSEAEFAARADRLLEEY